MSASTNEWAKKNKQTNIIRWCSQNVGISMLYFICFTPQQFHWNDVYCIWIFLLQCMTCVSVNTWVLVCLMLSNQLFLWNVQVFRILLLTLCIWKKWIGSNLVFFVYFLWFNFANVWKMDTFYLMFIWKGSQKWLLTSYEICMLITFQWMLGIKLNIA